MTAEAQKALKEKAFRLFDSGCWKGDHAMVAAICEVSRATIFRWLAARKKENKQDGGS